MHNLIQTLANGRTAYGIARFLGAKQGYSSLELAAARKRWQRWLKGENLSTLERLQDDARLLGYEITLKKITGDET